jgi:Ser/Thr protein kinase RdoA (MazF antagonist)
LFVRTDRLPTFNELVRFFARDHHDLAREIRAQRYRTLRELTRLRYGDLPDVPIHADFASWNLLFDDGDRVTGVLDFDLAHRDTRTADIAWSIMSDCAEPPTEIALDPRAVREFVAGYASEAPLTDAELALIVPLIRAQHFVVLAWGLYDWAREPTAHVLRRIRRRIDQRPSALDARAPELEDAVKEGADAGGA